MLESSRVAPEVPVVDGGDVAAFRCLVIHHTLQSVVENDCLDGDEQVAVEFQHDEVLSRRHPQLVWPDVL